MWKEKPSLGYYWLKDKNTEKTQIVKVVMIKGQQMIYLIGHEKPVAIDKLNVLWKGPINE